MHEITSFFCICRTYQQIPRRGCARCGNPIGSQELIMRAKDLVYHLNCFVCVVCLRALNKGKNVKKYIF